MSKTISIHERRERIKNLGEQLGIRQLAREDIEFLSSALIRIGNGEDPSTALDVAGRRGESKSEQARKALERKELVQITIKALREKGESLESIIARLGENDLHIFGLTEETLRTYSREKD